MKGIKSSMVLVMAASLLAIGEARSEDTGDAPHVVMHKDPTCGCCEKWADHLRAHGFTVDSRPSDDMLTIKKLRNIPPRGSSCHTADVEGYVIEGHVPAGDIKKLLAEQPDDIRVLTVPAMPLGSPGMEHPRPQNFRTFAIKTDDTVEIYAEHDAGEDFSPSKD